MFKMHIISDLNLGFNESSDPVDETIPDVDLVILNGNLGLLKRSALYAETLAKKYPNIEFIWNLGETERYWVNLEKFTGEIVESIEFRVKNDSKFPKNLHFINDSNRLITLKTGQVIDVFCTYGFPKIISYEGDWENTHWFKNYIAEIQQDTIIFPYKPNETSHVQHGMLPIWATQVWINQYYERINLQLKRWENEITGYKILVTHINPYNDTRFKGQKVYPYSIHLNNMAWVTANTKVENIIFLGANLISNPGRGLECRSKIIELNV